MKKVVYLLLISLFSLVGCNKNAKQVKYSSISEEDFLTYFSSEAKSSALANFSTIQKVRFANYQDVKSSTYSMKYTLNRDLDENYYYEYAKMVDNGGTGVSQALYIGEENVENCKYYQVSSSDPTKVDTGSTAVSLYNDSVSNVRNMVSHSINNYLFFTKQYIDLEKVTSTDYYLGDDESIKVVVRCSNDNQKDSATTIFDSETLLVKTIRCDFDNVEGKGYITMSFKYNVSFTHKTPKDIGYNEL